jgi:hypothetical protein
VSAFLNEDTRRLDIRWLTERKMRKDFKGRSGLFPCPRMMNFNLMDKIMENGQANKANLVSLEEDVVKINDVID